MGNVFLEVKFYFITPKMCQLIVPRALLQLFFHIPDILLPIKGIQTIY